ncbi:MAG: hypothetical protein II364_05110 [Bacteroidales bacterium]|nr:hypothetical protein [Bacteroidales bacterium]
MGLYALFGCRGQLGLIRANNIENEHCTQTESFDEAVALGNVGHFALSFTVGFVGFLPIIGQLLAKLFFLLAQPLCEFSVSAPFSHEPCAWVNSIVP